MGVQSCVKSERSIGSSHSLVGCLCLGWGWRRCQRTHMFYHLETQAKRLHFAAIMQWPSGAMLTCFVWEKRTLKTLSSEMEHSFPETEALLLHLLSKAHYMVAENLTHSILKSGCNPHVRRKFTDVLLSKCQHIQTTRLETDSAPQLMHHSDIL